MHIVYVYTYIYACIYIEQSGDMQRDTGLELELKR